LRSATASGGATANDIAIGLHTAPRAANGSGTGSSSLVQLLTVIRNASAHGQSSQTTTERRSVPLTATGFGGATAGDQAVGLHIAPRTATGFGVSGQTASYDTDPIQGITAGYWGLLALID
jgi:hypothetical protein